MLHVIDDTFCVDLFWVKGSGAQSYSNQKCYSWHLEQFASILLLLFSISLPASIGSLSSCPPDDVLRNGDR